MPELSLLELEYLLQEARRRSEVVDSAYHDIKSRQSKIREDQDKFLEEAKSSHEDVDISGDELARLTRARLDKDQESIKILTDHISDYHDKPSIPWPIRANKMSEIIEGTRDLFGDDETIVASIASGKYPLGIDNNPDITPFCTVERPEGNVFWGTSNVSFLSNALVTTAFTLLGVTLKNLKTEQRSKLFADSAVLYHVPLPDDLTVSDDYSYSYTNSYNRSIFGFIHSGYAFGGQRENSAQTRFGPEDCSSWVAKMTSCRFLYSTVHQLYAYRGTTGPDWIDKCEQELVTTKYTPVPLVEQTVPGDVYFLRAFKKDAGPSHQQAGFSGHTGILFAKDFNTRQLYTLSFNRDMPHREGFGIERFPMEPEQTETVERTVGFLRSR